MSEYGLKIKNYEAASIYEYQKGIRDNLDSTDAMLTNSLFKDYIIESGLSVWNGESTRDIICLQFTYGTKDYDGMLERIAKSKRDEETKERMRARIEPHREKFEQMSKQELREKYYCDGVEITYRTHNKKGEVIKEETIKYRMLYRTPGKAKKGTCMFIAERLYGAAHNFLWMGMDEAQVGNKLVEVGAYSSLITSSIVGDVKIEPEQLLIVKDVETFMRTDVVKVGSEHRRFTVGKEKAYPISSTLFDGQALIDYSIFPDWGEGYVLLRHHFTKMAAFKANIEQFMRDRFGSEYETATVKDMFGRDVRVKDVKLITTDNAIKWLKFGVSFDYWADWVRANGCRFGIVKTAHPSKLGGVQRMSYQMVNALPINKMESITKTTRDYIADLKADDEVFLDYLRKNTNFTNDYDVLLALVKQDPEFVQSEYFRDRRKHIISAYVTNFKAGRVIQNGDNLTIVGSPYAMLLHSVGDDPLQDPTFSSEEGAIQCWTARFEDGEYLAEFRNPFNSRNNLGYVHNVYHEYFNKYFDFGELIIAVNMNCTDFQARNNGLTKWVSA